MGLGTYKKDGLVLTVKIRRKRIVIEMVQVLRCFLFAASKPAHFARLDKVISRTEMEFGLSLPPIRSLCLKFWSFLAVETIMWMSTFT